MANDDVEGEAQQPFRLLDLPPELWSRVCYFATMSTGPITYNISKSLQERQASVQQPGITRTCRALRAEALPIFYAKTDFVVWDEFHPGPLQVFKRWMDAIGPRNRGLIRTVTIQTCWQLGLWDGWTGERTKSFAWGLDLEPSKMNRFGYLKKATIFERH